MYIYTTEFEYEGDNGSIAGVATLQYEINESRDADIGGVDGREAENVELLFVAIDGLQLTRIQVEELMLTNALATYEEAIREEIQDQINSGDL